MKKETWLIAAVALIAGILVGVVVMKGGGEKTPPSTQSPPVTAPPTRPASGYQAEIQMLEKTVAEDPQNRRAWVTLGHLYFDSNQPVKAVDAYDQALRLDPNDPDVLTDQGVMFRRLGWFERALENFSKANSLDPTHATSVFNQGIVYRYDLQDFDKAREAWLKFLEINPTGPNADKVRAELDFLKNHPAVPEAK